MGDPGLYWLCCFEIWPAPPDEAVEATAGPCTPRLADVGRYEAWSPFFGGVERAAIVCRAPESLLAAVWAGDQGDQVERAERAIELFIGPNGLAPASTEQARRAAQTAVR